MKAESKTVEKTLSICLSKVETLEFDIQARPSACCSLTFSGNFINRCVRFLGHVAENGEDDEPGKEACDAVDRARGQSVPAVYTSFCCSSFHRSYANNMR